ncbi:uncharacterized protein LOC144866502 [Branchiostoma floridae x Branchiostoma japonicum]
MALKRAAFSILVTMVAAAIVHVDTKTSCRLCQPGYHMVRKCKDKQPNATRCARCPASSYTDLPNMEKGCYPHRKCNATSEVMVFPGNATHDVICEPCDTYTQPCQPCHECPPGKGVEITDADLSIEKAIHTSEDDSIKLEERKWLIINTVLTALILMLVLGFLVFIRSKETCSQRTYEEEGHVALPVQCEDTHPKELEASSSVDSRWSAATRLLPDQSTTVTRLSSSTLSTQDVNEWSPMIPPANVEDMQETQNDNRSSACNSFPVADGFHTLPKASSSAHMASQSRQHLPFRPMSCSTDTIPSTLASSHETSASSLEYREKVYSTLARSYANILTASVTEELKTSLGEQWPELARRLKLKEYQIDQIVNENRSDLQGQIYNMLRCWQQGKTEATIPELYGALKECNRLDIMQKLQALEGSS